MPARRRKTSAGKMTAQAAPEEEVKRPSVTQVVEVVGDEASEPPVEAPPVEEPPVEEALPEEPSTTKSMVEELYTTEKRSNVMPEISMHKNGSGKPLMVWAIVTIIVALLTGGILFAASKKTSMPSLFTQPTPTPTPAPTPTPTPTPAEVDKSSFEIQVLNGGGTPGAAGKMKTFLEDKGYTVASTGNTKDYTYDTTEIHGKPTMTDAVANLKADLKDSYTLGTVDTTLDASSSADVQVIVGKE
jgi:hypothetical protein